MAASISSTVWTSDVYEPSDDTFLLVDSLQQHATKWHASQIQPMTFVEIGCGSGFVSCSIALMLNELGIKAQITAIDINPSATEATRQTLLNHRVKDVELITMDLLEGLCPSWQGTIDVLVFNPPYVVTPDCEVKQNGIARAWAGGEMGRRVIDRLLAKLPSLLSPTGEMFMITIAQNNPRGIIEEMKNLGFSGSILSSRRADEELLSVLHLRRDVAERPQHSAS